MLNYMFNNSTFNNKYKNLFYKNKCFSDQINLNKFNFNKLNTSNIIDYKNIIKECNDKYTKNLLKKIDDDKIKKYKDETFQLDNIKTNNSNQYLNNYFFVIFVLSGLWIYNKR